MKLSDLCREDRIIIPLLAKDRDGVLLEIAQALHQEGAIPSADELMGLLLEREKQLTTAIGHGVAIPHTRPWEVLKPILVFGRTALPVDFNSLDGEPVRLIFLLITPKGNISLHLKLLSRISRMMQNESLRRGLLEARSPKDALTCLQNGETDYFDLTS